MADYSIEFKNNNTAESSMINSVLWAGENVIGRCSISEEDSVFTISAWYVDKEYQNKGLGRKLLFDTFDKFESDRGTPLQIQYNWNGTNNYVFDWLSENFAPLSMCPISVLKYEDIYPADVPEGHLYKLDREAFLTYKKNYLSNTNLVFDIKNPPKH